MYIVGRDTVGEWTGSFFTAYFCRKIQNRDLLQIRPTILPFPIPQVGSHYHFIETNPYLVFDRAAAYGMRLNIAAGTAVRFEVCAFSFLEQAQFPERLFFPKREALILL
jgi:hypothetical protein